MLFSTDLNTLDAIKTAVFLNIALSWNAYLVDILNLEKPSITKTVYETIIDQKTWSCGL